MARITITIFDHPDEKLRGRVHVESTAGQPRVGCTLTPAQALAQDLLTQCHRRADSVAFGVSAQWLADRIATDVADGTHAAAPAVTLSIGGGA